MNKLVKDLIVIVVITVIAGALLGAVYTITKDPIAKQEALTEQKALNTVFSEADHFTEQEVKEDALGSSSATLDKLYTAMDASENLLGYVLVITSHEGYGGDITFSMGISLDGMTKGISITSISETVGLGMNASKVLVPQFTNRTESEYVLVKSDHPTGNEIKAISSATITSTAVVKAVNLGLSYYQEKLGGVISE